MKTATNPNTGQRVFLNEATGDWEELVTATNPTTGEVVYLQDGTWTAFDGLTPPPQPAIPGDTHPPEGPLAAGPERPRGRLGTAPPPVGPGPEDPPTPAFSPDPMASEEVRAANTGSVLGDLMAGWLGLRNAGTIAPAVIADAIGRTDGGLVDQAREKFGLPQPEGPSKSEMAQELSRRLAERALPTLMERQARTKEIPQSEAAQEAFAAETWADAWRLFLERPGEITRTAVFQSLPQSAPAAIGAVLGQLGGPQGAAGGAFLGGAITEAGSSSAQGMVEAFKAAGVDTSDPEAVTAFMSENQDLIDELFATGLQRGGIIGAFDAISAGLAGRLAANTVGKGALPRVTAVPAGTAIEGTGGAAGEAAAQLATEGEIVPGEVLAEAIGEVGAGGPQVIGQMITEALRRPQTRIDQGTGATPETAPRVEALPERDPRGAAPAQPVAPTTPAPVTPGAPAQAQSPETPGAPTAPEPGAAPATPAAQPQPGAPALDTPPQSQAAPEAPQRPVPGEAQAPTQTAPGVQESTRPGEPDPLEGVQFDAERTEGGFYPRASPEDGGQRTFRAQAFETREEAIAAAPRLWRDFRRGATQQDQAAPGQQVAAPTRNVRLPKKPLTDRLRAIGVRPGTPLAAELRARDITPRTHPGLFRKNGAGAWDNLPASEWRDYQGQIDTDDTGQYLSEAALVEAVAQEAAGNPVLTPEQAQIRDEQAAEARRVERTEAVDSALAQLQLANEVNSQERDAIIAAAIASDEDPVELIVAALEREIDRAPTSPDEPATEIPWDAPPAPQDESRGDPKEPESVIPTEESRQDGARDDEGLFPGLEDDDGGKAQRDQQEVEARQQQSKSRRLDQTRVEDDTDTIFGRDRQPKLLKDRADANAANASTNSRDARSPKEDARLAETDASPDAPSDGPQNVGKTTQPQGTLAPTFLNFSYTDRNSVHEAAFRFVGIPPDRAKILAPGRQIRILQRVIKDKFGIEVVLPQRIVRAKSVTGRTKEVSRDQIQPLDAISQLLDAYRGLELMAHIFGIPSKGVALKDKSGKPIKLALQGVVKGALGMYNPATRTIHLPGRSNSFAHEWAHALDHWMAEFLLDEPNPGKLLTQQIFEEGVNPEHTNRQRVARAFAQVMQAMFEDGSKMAALQMELAALARAGDKKAAQILDDMAQGKAPPEGYRSRYFESSKEYDDMVAAKGYFTEPWEVLARAFESYIGIRASQVSDLPMGFLNKPSFAYDGSEDARAKLTFPKGADAAKIFAALHRLGHELRRTEIFGPGGRAQKPQDTDVFDVRHWDKWKDDRSLVEREKAQWRSWNRGMKERGPSGRQKAADFLHQAFSTYSYYVHRLIDRQPKEARKSLKRLADMFMTDPGSGRVIKETWEEAVEREAKRNTNRLDNLIRAHNLDGYTADQLAQLRRALTDEGVRPPTPEMEKAAAALRRMLDDVWRYVASSGVKIGYARNGYLPRILDLSAVMENEGKFMAQAKKVYQLMFEKDVGKEMSEDLDPQIEDMDAVRRMLSKASRVSEDGDRFQVNLMAPHQKQVDAWLKSRKRLKALQRRMREAKKPETKERLAAEIDEHVETDLKPKHDAMLELLSDLFSSERAEEWLSRAIRGSSMDFDTKGPSTTFLKSRTLPPEADALMADFYEGNPLTLIQDYLQMAPRRAEYVRRAGLNGEKIEDMLKAAGDRGASPYDIREMRHLINLLAGREARHDLSQAAWVGGWAYVTATIILLRRAFFSSLAEPLSAGIRTGNSADSLRAMAGTIKGLVRAGDHETIAETARVIGLVTSAEHETIMLNRYGGDIDPNRRQGKTLANFFRYTLLTQLTNLQRQRMMTVADHAVRRWVKQSLEGSEKKKKQARENLAELGIDASNSERMQDFMTWLEGINGVVPASEELQNPDGTFFNEAAEMWAKGTSRLVQQIIQNPKKYSRPVLAQSPGTRMIYGIMGFIFSFHQNVLRPLVRKHIDDQMENESWVRYAARVTGGSARNITVAFPAIAALYGGQMLAFMLRTALFNPDAADDMDDEEYAEWLLKQALVRSGLLGKYDVPLQLVAGLKYETDLAGLYAGPHIRYHFDQMQDVLGIFGRNSPNTDNAENRALTAALGYVVDQSVMLGLSMTPGGPLTTGLRAPAIWAWDAANPHELMADEIIPP